jgi:hypothetical protein
MFKHTSDVGRVRWSAGSVYCFVTKTSEKVTL